MDKKILFNFMAHECESCLNDLTESIRMSYPNSCIVFHINAAWKNFNPSSINGLNEFVFLNPIRQEFYDKHIGFTGIFISNIDYINSLRVDYDFVVFGASNEIYYQSIDINYFIKHQYGSSHYRTPDGLHIRGVDMNKFCSINNLKNGAWNGYMEGMFMSKDILNSVVSLYKKYFGEAYHIFDCDHEQLLHTLLYNVVDDNGIGTITAPINANPIEGVSDNHPITVMQHFANLNNTTNNEKKFSFKPLSRTDLELRKRVMEFIRKQQAHMA